MSGLSLALLTAFLVVTVALDLVWSPRLAARTRAALAGGSATARIRLYRIIVASAWAQAAIGFALLLGAGLSLVEIGFRSGDHIVDALPYIVAIPVGLVFSVIGARKKGVEPRMVGDIELLIPRTKTEQRWFVATALTAGITEETTYRAVPILLFVGLFPHQHRAVGAAIGALLFGVAHLYQGVGGVIATTVVGGAFAFLYVYTEALWPGMLLHALMDLRLLLLFPLKRSQKAATSPL